MPIPLANPSAQDRSTLRAPVANRRFDAPLILRLWHLASLDAPTVAVAWALSFAWAARVKLPPWLPLLLALVTWTVYVADRLLDAHAALSAGQTDGLRERHYFHHRHRRILGPLALASASIATWMVVALMPHRSLELNSALAAAAVAYFSGVHTRRLLPGLPASLLFSDLPLPKELRVGVLFTAACVLPALARLATGHGASLWPLIAVTASFAALVWLNCHAIERWESHGQRSRTFAAASALALATLLLAAILLPIAPRAAALASSGALSALLLALLDRLRHRLTPLALRTAADLVLLCPVALLWR